MKIHKYENYERYLLEQKQHEKTADRTKIRSRKQYIEKIQASFPDTKKVLCVGSRHPSEVLEFRNLNYEAIGIDLFSNDESIIRTIDMHSIIDTFQENEFDIIFSCHSLEHSYNPSIVLQGFRKCSRYGAFIVLPLSITPNKKDPCVFNFMTKFDQAPSALEIQEEIFSTSGVMAEIKDIVYRPNPFDGLWLSLAWS